MSGSAVDSPSWDTQRESMVERQLRARGIRDERVLDALGRVPRERFLPEAEERLAYHDRAVPLGHGQTISQPFMVAAMTESLTLSPDDRVLEIGTGSGYQTAVLAELTADVYSVERVPQLAERAHQILHELGYDNVCLRVGDGCEGWPEEAPFDAILVTAGAAAVPPALKAQMSPEGGRLVMPVGPRHWQTLSRYLRIGTEVTTEQLMACRFVPLVGEGGW